MTMETITRAYLAKVISEDVGLSISEASKIIDVLFDEMSNVFVTENSLKIASFGSFSKRVKNERIGRNPKTKKPAVITRRNVISFNPSRKLRARVNNVLST